MNTEAHTSYSICRLPFQPGEPRTLRGDGSAARQKTERAS